MLRIVIAAMLIAAGPANAEDRIEAPRETDASAAELAVASEWHGVDADEDGVRDDIALWFDAQSVVPTSDSADSAVEQALREARAASMSRPAPRGQSRCTDYLLLDPEKQAEANRFMQGRASGAFGSHPCDPVVSPRIERPYDENYVDLDLGPAVLRYDHP